MRLESLKVRGLGPFRSDVSLDLAGVPGVLTAVTGENGAGKSTLLELFAGALFRECPTRGTLASLATSRDSMVEVTVVNGHRWTVRQLVDATSGKGEAVVLDEAGAPVTQSGKLKEADAWVASHLPAPSVFFSTIFAAQGTSGFLGMKPAERKSVLLRILGIEHLEQLAARARERQREAEGAARVLEARLADERARGGDVAELEGSLADMQTGASLGESSLAIARADLETARATHATAQAAWQAGRSHLAKVDKLQREYEAASQRLEDAVARGMAADYALSHATPLEALEAAVASARRALDSAKAVHATEVAGYDAAQGMVKRHRELTEERRALEVRADNNRKLLANADAVREAVAAVVRFDGEITLAQVAIDAADATLREVQDKRAAGADERIAGLREGLEEIAGACSLDRSEDLAGRALEADDAAVSLAQELPNLLRAAQGEAAAARRALTDLQAERSAAAKVAANGAHLAEAEARLAAYGERLAAIAHELAELGEVRSPLRPRDEPVQQAASVLARAESALSHGRQEQATAERDQAAAAAARAELSPLVERLRHDLQELQGVEVPFAPDTASLDAAIREVRQLEDETRRLAGDVTRAAQRLEDARASAERAATLEGELGAARIAVGDWTRLATDLGRDGLQAMEIDAAGPELTALANDLLHSCHGPRWTVSIETQKLSADGKKVLEGCEVRVLDSERGRDAPAETLSGGEAVLVGEAVALALSTLACRRQGVTRPTLVRDESGAALSPANSRVYVAMLRRAAQLVDADRVLIVSHTPEVWELCDSRVHVAGGKVEVQ